MESRIQVEGWKKMEAAAQNRAEDGEEWSVAYVPSKHMDTEEEDDHGTTPGKEIWIRCG